jgi:hypothetical protein
MDSLHGKNNATFEQLWSVIVSIVLYSLLVGSLVMKSSVIVPNGIDECSGAIGCWGVFG